MHDDRRNAKRENAALERSDGNLSKRHPNFVKDILSRGRRELTRAQVATDSFAEGVSALYEKRYGDAVKAFEKTLESNSDASQAHYYLGLTRFMLGRYSAAVESYSAAIESGYTEPEVVQSLADALLLLERYGEAVEAYEASLRLRPSADAYARMGQALSLMGERERAVRAFKEALLLKLSSASVGDIDPLDDLRAEQKP